MRGSVRYSIEGMSAAWGRDLLHRPFNLAGPLGTIAARRAEAGKLSGLIAEDTLTRGPLVLWVSYTSIAASFWADAFIAMARRDDMVKGSDSEAITERQKAIELEPTSAGVYIELDGLYKAQGRTGEAITLYRAAAKRNPAAAWPHIELVKTYLE